MYLNRFALFVNAFVAPCTPDAHEPHLSERKWRGLIYESRGHSSQSAACFLAG
jgi:hypothetical protein